MRCFFLCIILFAAFPAWAVEDGSGDLLLPMLKVFGGLALVLGLMLLLYGLSRKGFRFLPGPKSGAIQVLEMRGLGTKKSLCLVKVRGGEYLLGVGPSGVNLLSRIDCGESPSFEQTLESSLGGDD